mgnify:CR=1 FL=1
MSRTVSIRARIDRLETECREYGAPASKLHEARLVAFAERISRARERAGISGGSGHVSETGPMSIADRLDRARKLLREQREAG